MSVHEMRALLKKMATQLDGHQKRVPTDDILEMAKSIQKSRICKHTFCLVYDFVIITCVHISVRRGGMLFEMWVNLMGSYTSYRKVRSHIADKPNERLSREDEEVIVLREKVKFHGYVISAVHNIGNTGKTQMFFLSFTAKFHGLSNMGQDMLARYGFMMKPTLFSQERAESLSSCDTQTR
jgi:hypothetical protein